MSRSSSATSFSACCSFSMSSCFGSFSGWSIGLCLSFPSSAAYRRSARTFVRLTSLVYPMVKTFLRDIEHVLQPAQDGIVDATVLAHFKQRPPLGVEEALFGVDDGIFAGGLAVDLLTAMFEAPAQPRHGFLVELALGVDRSELLECGFRHGKQPVAHLVIVFAQIFGNREQLHDPRQR